MLLVNALSIPRTFFSFNDFVFEADDIEFGNPWWFVYAGVSCLLVLFAGIMSGLTLGLMSLGLVDLEILQRSGSSTEKKQAAAILPVVQKQHQLLVTLLLCNACAMEALPIYLDKIFHPFVAVLLSVTFVLTFGEIIPQAVCSRYGLSVGANFVWLVRILMIICYPIAYPIGKVLDVVLGHSDTLFRRAQLKALVTLHSQEAGKGGELTHDETTIISGALDLTEKTAEEAMTPIESTFSLEVNSKLDWEAIGKILARGHSRVPVYSGSPKNIIGLLLVKSLLTVRAETETPVSAVSIRRIPRVPSDMPLYDILNEFQKGSSHMAAVVKVKGRTKNPLSMSDGGNFNENKIANGKSELTKPLITKHADKSESVFIDVEHVSRRTSSKLTYEQNVTGMNSLQHFSEDIEDGEVIGIITLEDVFEELLQEEIVDETDVYVDVHRRIRVAAAAAASSVARSPSSRRLPGQKPTVDSRILKAVAIENSKNAEAAVEIVLSEVLPYLSKHSMVSNMSRLDSSSHGSSDEDAEQEDQSNVLKHRQVGGGKTAGTSESRSIFNENDNKVDLTSGVHFSDSTHQEKRLELHTAVSGDPVVDTSKLKGNAEGEEEVILLEKPDNSWSGIIKTSEIMSNGLVNEHSVDDTQVCLDVETIVAASLCNPQDIHINNGHEQIPQDMSSRLIEENAGSTSGGSSNSTFRNSPQEESCLDSMSVEVENSVIEQTASAADCDIHPKFSSTPCNNCESVDSKQESKIDLLEEIIEAAKNNKKTLFMVMESVLNMMRKVELQEKAAEQAKEEAAGGGLGILVKVEELKQMLAHAKEGNDMHAGEIYGEKAILSTEVRELWGRLLCLSDERDKSLAILDEMHQTLEGRLAAAEELRKAAEQEKLEKEESARKALADQEAIMDKVVHEAEILQQEAGENSKLREFLMDRGRVVDTLQGEISVICQDVRLLKEKFDAHVPLSQSISSSQTSCILASSGSLLKSIASHHQLEETSKSPKEMSPTSSVDGLSPNNKLEEQSILDRKEILVDGWDFVQ